MHAWRFSARGERHLMSGVPLGAVSSRVTMMMDVSLTGWRATMMRRAVNGTWDPKLAQAHINVLELEAVFFALKFFLQFLQGYHVLVRTDNSTVVACINRQGGTCSLQLQRLAQGIIMWRSTCLFGLHVPGVLNRRSDLLS